jgi:3-phenylpropionate/trans-cinnamate dioxygenase ferredoxin subunit
MADFTTLAKVEDVPKGEVRAFDANGVPVAIANVDGSFYAFEDTCTHRQCSLAEGELEEFAIVCPCHGSAFDVRTGEVVNPPARDAVGHFELKVEGDEIQVEVDA